jgi:hypothetical protein
MEHFIIYIWDIFLKLYESLKLNVIFEFFKKTMCILGYTYDFLHRAWLFFLLGTWFYCFSFVCTHLFGNYNYFSSEELIIFGCDACIWLYIFLRETPRLLLAIHEIDIILVCCTVYFLIKLHGPFFWNKAPFLLIKGKFLEVLQIMLDRNQAKNKSLLSRHYITHGLSPGKFP